ncbi:uncharacterized protein L3040_007841 [Drepanopeziza brunnea f. sp. 'multigermtubi']|uniref:uncharacterized protein n=1 Tax=Drepanopeziza brunnea f. sp. 'multigermtubi' TaxID=698441 RepID=UPI00239C852A|nr:hypothetical protein L3040_007841 [Drepanopeziza brunnea f. sp. 'multigermtubi']
MEIDVSSKLRGKGCFQVLRQDREPMSFIKKPGAWAVLFLRACCQSQAFRFMSIDSTGFAKGCMSWSRSDSLAYSSFLACSPPRPNQSPTATSS